MERYKIILLFYLECLSMSLTTVNTTRYTVASEARRPATVVFVAEDEIFAQMEVDRKDAASTTVNQRKGCALRSHALVCNRSAAVILLLRAVYATTAKRTMSASSSSNNNNRNKIHSSSLTSKRTREDEGDEKKDPTESEPEAKKSLKFEDDCVSGGIYISLHPQSSATDETPQFELRELTSSYCDKRRTNDEIHSTVKLGPVLTCILDTPPMQRLRGLKQLGTAEYVFVNVNHNRLEHSLGVAVLAAALCTQIRTNQPSLRCTAKDVLCVQLAGLLHDIGHGPFSHSYEDFVCHVHPEYLSKQSAERQREYYQRWPALSHRWSHECASLLMIDAVLEHLGLAVDLRRLDQPLRQIGSGVKATSMRVFDSDLHPHPDNEEEAEDSTVILTSRDFVFVKECIWGKPIPAIEAVLGPGFHGRKEEYQDWLYDIVSNRHSGLDVDKVDYYARDQRRALRESGEIDKVMIEEAVVAWAACTDPIQCHRCSRQKKYNGTNYNNNDNKHLMICYPDKLIGASMEFFKTRFTLHSKIYRHKTNEAVAFMISDILCQADAHFLIPTAPLTGGQLHRNSHFRANNAGAQMCGDYDFLPLSRAMLHPGSYLRLRDSVIDQIAATTSPELEGARRLIDRLWSRNLYKCVATKVLRRQRRAADRSIWEKPSDEILREILAFKGTHGGGGGGGDGGTNNTVVVALNEDDVIVQKCEIHHGQKDQDPLTKMRFLEKGYLNKISVENYRDLPEAVMVDEEEYDSYLPRSLMECSLRIYCKESAKVELLRHLFCLWWQEIHAEMELTVGVGKGKAMAVTQETDDDEDCNDDDDDDLMEHRMDRRTSHLPWCSPN